MRRNTINPKMDRQKLVTLDGFGVCVDPREHFVKNATLSKNCMPKHITLNKKFVSKIIFFFNVGVLPHAKKLFPFTMQGEQAYSKFKAPIETGLQTNYDFFFLLNMTMTHESSFLYFFFESLILVIVAERELILFVVQDLL